MAPRLPDVHFGPPTEEQRDLPDVPDRADDDEERPTPADVEELLGFDPADEEQT